MLSAKQLEGYITEHLNCAHIQVLGDDGAHFEATIVSEVFEGQSMVQQHQTVYAALGDRMREEIHALSMQTLTPAQWQAKNS